MIDYIMFVIECLVRFTIGLLVWIIGLKFSILICMWPVLPQRETLNAALSFSKRNNLPKNLRDQMIAHLSLKHRIDSEGVQQQETVDSLPKAIRTSISHFLFYSLVDKVYLFQGVSNDLLFQLVTLHLFLCPFFFFKCVGLCCCHVYVM